MPSDEQLVEAADEILHIIGDMGYSPQSRLVAITASPLARHYKSTRDETAIDEAWLVSIGFEVCNTIATLSRDVLFVDIRMMQAGGVWSVNAGANRIAVVTTRQQLLNMLTALGIEVTAT